VGNDVDLDLGAGKREKGGAPIFKIRAVREEIFSEGDDSREVDTTDRKNHLGPQKEVEISRAGLEYWPRTLYA